MKPRAISSFLPGALAFGVPAALSSYWVWTAFQEPWRAREWVIWAAERSPIPLTVAPEELAKDLVHPNGLIVAGLVAAFFCLASLKLLFDAQRGRRASDETEDRKARLELKSSPLRVGRPVEGRLWLAREAAAGDMFTVTLHCYRPYRRDGKNQKETAYFAEQEVRVVPDARGWSVPFRFEVPASAPQNTVDTSGAQPLISFGDRLQPYHWLLSAWPADKLLAFPSAIELYLGPAPREELLALEAGETPAQKEALDAVSRGLAALGGPLPPHQREQLKALSPEDLAIARKVTSLGGAKALKLVVWLVVAFFAFFLVLPVIAGVFIWLFRR